MNQHGIICFVDDDEIYKFTVNKMLEKKNLGKETITFGDGEEALEFLKENKNDKSKLPDIIFLDINMPIMDGFQFMDEYVKLKPELTKKIIIYMITSSIDPVDKNHAAKYEDITDFIVKPISSETLESLIKRVNQ